HGSQFSTAAHCVRTMPRPAKIAEPTRIILMQKRKIKTGWRRFLATCAIIAIALSTQAVTPYDYAVKVSATVSTSPAQITLSWPSNIDATGYNISRKAVTSSSWTPVANLGSGATGWTDSNVSVGAAYEYQITAPTSDGYTATGYIY